MDEIIFGLLFAEPTVAATVGNRIYPVEAPAGCVRPYIVHRCISDVPDYVNEGEGPRDARVQLDVWADTYGSAQQVGKAVRSCLSGYQSPDQSTAPRVLIARILNAFGRKDSETGYHGMTVDVGFTFVE